MKSTRLIATLCALLSFAAQAAEQKTELHLHHR
jgi:hypothetical protein